MIFRPHLSILVVQFLHEFRTFHLIKKAGTDAGIQTRVFHPDHRTVVFRSYLESHVQFAGSSTAHHDRDAQTRFLHLVSHMHHFIERRRNQSAQSDGIHLFLDSLLDNLFGRNHHT